MKIEISGVPEALSRQNGFHLVSLGLMEGWQSLPENNRQLVVELVVIGHPPTTTSTEDEHMVQVNTEIQFEVCVDDIPFQMKIPVCFLLDSKVGDLRKQATDTFVAEVKSSLARICKALQNEAGKLFASLA